VRQRHAVDTREVLWASSPATQLPAPPSNPHRRFDACAHGTSAPQSTHRSHNLRVRPMRRAVRWRPPLRILQSVLRCPGTRRGVSRLRPPRSRRRPARRGGVHQDVIHSVARIGVDMPLCSRRAWTTCQGPLDPSRLTTYPPQVATTTASSIHVFNQISRPEDRG
jgi:hypothetical protein